MWDEIQKKGDRYQALTALIESPDGPGNPNYANWLREKGRMTKFGSIWEGRSRDAQFARRSVRS